MTKRKFCDLCGMPDDSFRIEENGEVLKVCKLCYDGYLERNGLPSDIDERVDDVILTLDLDSADDIEPSGDSNFDMKVEALNERELQEILNGGYEDKRVIDNVNRRFKRREKKIEIINNNYALEDMIVRDHKDIADNAADSEEIKTPALTKDVKSASDRVNKDAIRKAAILAAANQRSEDERIKITSPEVQLVKDVRPRTNLDVAISEYAGGIRFIDSFKYIINKVSYCVFFSLIVIAVSTVLFITQGWKVALIAFCGGAAAVISGFLLVWYLSWRLALDKRAYLLRIRQQEILFASIKTDCYRELKTKFTVLKALGWLLNKLSVIMPAAVILCGAVAAVIVTFLVKTWLFAVILCGAAVGGVVVYWIIKFFADLIAYKLDIERNQQVEQQTLLDLLDEIRKN